MNEIEKMYELARVKPVCDGLDCFICTAKCNNGKYPEFTEEKQFNLIKWLIKKYVVTFGDYSDNEELKEGIAEMVINVWCNLTEEERAEIRKILEK